MNNLEMILLEEPFETKLKDNIMNDNINNSGVISGKKIIIEREGKLEYLFDKKLHDMTIAEINFIMRRPDIMWDGDNDMKLYYGHVGLYGYFVVEDEMEKGY